MRSLPRNVELAVDLVLKKMDDQLGGLGREDR